MNVIANLRRYRWNRYRCYVFVGQHRGRSAVREHAARALLGQFRHSENAKYLVIRELGAEQP